MPAERFTTACTQHTADQLYIMQGWAQQVPDPHRCLSTWLYSTVDKRDRLSVSLPSKVRHMMSRQHECLGTSHHSPCHVKMLAGMFG
jgi:hypothetical protein